MQRLKGVVELVSSLAVIVAAGVLVWIVALKPSAVAREAAPRAATVEDVTDTLGKAFVRNVAGTGDLAIVEFTDFQCPFCARHTTQAAPALKALDGVRNVSLHMPLGIHPQAIPAAVAAECAAEQGKFWDMHAALFEGQQGLATAAPSFAAYVPQLGLDAARFETCLTDGAALARVTADQQEAERLKVNSTPTLFIGRMRPDGGIDTVKRINGAYPAETVAAEVAKLTKG